MFKQLRVTRFAVVVLLSLFAGSNAMAGGLIEMDFDSGNFDDPLNIDNRYWPLEAGTTFIYFAEGEDGCEWNEVDVTDAFKTISGVDARVVLDRVWLDESEDCADKLADYPAAFPYAVMDGSVTPYGAMTEITDDWYAQDNGGNIWYLGEHTIELNTPEEDCDTFADPDAVFGLTGCMDGSFEAGIDDAEAGIVMLADPSKGDFYQQEFSEDNAEDFGKVLNFVPIEDAEDCLKTKEWSPLEPGAVEHKYYCPDIDEPGNILVEEVSGGPKVWVELIDVIHDDG